MMVPEKDSRLCSETKTPVLEFSSRSAFPAQIWFTWLAEKEKDVENIHFLCGYLHFLKILG